MYEIGSGNHRQSGNFEGYCEVWRLSAISCAKMAEPIELSFEMWTQVGPRKHALDRMHIAAIWRI